MTTTERLREMIRNYKPRPGTEGNALFAAEIALDAMTLAESLAERESLPCPDNRKGCAVHHYCYKYGLETGRAAELFLARHGETR